MAKTILAELVEVEIFIADSGFSFGQTMIGGRMWVLHTDTKKKECFRLAPKLEYWLAFKAFTNLEKGTYELTLDEKSNCSPYRRSSCMEIVDIQPKKIKTKTKVETKIADCFGTDAVFFVSETQHDQHQ